VRHGAQRRAARDNRATFTPNGRSAYSIRPHAVLRCADALSWWIGQTAGSPAGRWGPGRSEGSRCWMERNATSSLADTVSGAGKSAECAWDAPARSCDGQRACSSGRAIVPAPIPGDPDAGEGIASELRFVIETAAGHAREHRCSPALAVSSHSY
jgi:hypothetical protein